MRALTAELGEPQRNFRSLHLVGTNGKTSVARMTEALLKDRGIRVGTCVSPHLRLWRERVTVDGQVVGEAPFRAAVETVAAAAARVEGRAGTGGDQPGGRLEPGERLTQFEIATAAAFVVLAEAGVEIGAIEAGLGGRLDATNVIGSELTVLTSIGLDHTEWLGETEIEIATEKLAVLRPRTALLTGPLSPAVRELAERTAAERDCRLLDPGAPLPGADTYRDTNLALALAAAEEMLGAELDRQRAATIVSRLTVPGRLEWCGDRPPRLLDVAHNPAGAAALAAALPGMVDGRPVIACLAVLAEKDAAGLIEALAPCLSRAICTELPAAALRASGRPGAGSHPAADLAALLNRHEVPAKAVSEPAAALAAAARAAADEGGVMLVTGSHYLVAIARECPL